jgi:hypothetical protein
MAPLLPPFESSFLDFVSLHLQIGLTQNLHLVLHGKNQCQRNPLFSEATDPTNQSSDPFPDTEGAHYFEEPQSEIKVLKDQILVALSKVK